MTGIFMKDEEKFACCWYCDNLLSFPDQIGLLYLGFPRCMVVIPNKYEFYFSTYEDFLDGLTRINWLDPSDKGTAEEREEVLRTLWNFSIAQEAREEEIYDENINSLD